jgi:hypothetical protein
MLFNKNNPVYCVERTKHGDTLCRQNTEFNMLKQVTHVEITGW